MTFKRFLLLIPALFLSLALAACDNNSGNTQTSMADDAAQIAPAAGDSSADALAPVARPDTVEGTPGVSEGGEAGLAAPEVMPEPDTGVPAPAVDETAGACPYQELVGKTKADIDMNAFTQPVRVLYPDSPATMDYNADRVNIILEHGTDMVTEVRCG